jgi:hypothetical protein
MTAAAKGLSSGAFVAAGLQAGAFYVALIVLRRLLVEFHINRVVHRGKLQILLFKIGDVLIVYQRQTDIVQSA